MRVVFVYMSIIFAAFLVTYAQETFVRTNDGEQRLSSLNSTLISEQKKLDSLNFLLKERAAGIRKEKEKSSPDNDKVTELMSNSINLSNHIDKQQKKVADLEHKIEKVKNDLRMDYSGILDSLKELKTKKPNDTEIESAILRYTEKKLSVSQKIGGLSFNPEKILSLDPASIKSPGERKIYKDYLKRALEEVNDQIIYLEEQYSEITQIVSLQKKAEKFLEEAELSNDLSFSRRSTSSAEAVRGNYDPKDWVSVSDAQALTGMINQFRTIKPVGQRSGSLFSFNLNNISLKDYQKIIKELTDNLQGFKSILKNKTKSIE